MPARVVLPRSLAGFSHGASKVESDGSAPLDLETKLRRAATEVLSSGATGAPDGDLLEALACQACEVLEDLDVCSDEASLAAAKEALQEAVEPLLVEADLQVSPALLEALLVAAEVRPASSKAGEDLQLPSSLKLPSLLPAQRTKVKHHIEPRCGSVGHSDCASATEPVDAASDANAPQASEKDEAPQYVRRGEKARAEAADYLREHTVEVRRQQEEAAARFRDVTTFTRWPQHGGKAAREAAGSVPGVQGPAPQPAESSDSDDDDEEEDEATKREREATKRRLRELGEPATFFGESDSARWRRLQRLELTRDQDVLATGSTNVMQILDRRQKREREAAGLEKGPDVVDAEDADFQISENKAARKAGTVEADEQSDSDENETGAQAAPIGVGEEPNPEAEQAQQQLDTASHSVMAWLRNMLRAWEKALTDRAAKEEKQNAFKMEKAQYRQSKQYLKPLRRALRDGEVDPGVVFSIAEIAGLSDKRQYRLAKEAYMRLAIGNHAWPMGVTFVTFHDRANRHKIGEGAHAHVLDDETTRKYVQMIKRLVTFAESYWPVDSTLAE
eukprot:TRINITY_DN8902_c0_g1_i1.p1 TRINITY_DN8902_c0_g1~~TRINITY_DN8902_c0_g1_i1.p1  ORF type:complete len:572 (-),score=153.79 TRINITY_DN8902_c0_g1_i1:37-1722(-)